MLAAATLAVVGLMPAVAANAAGDTIIDQQWDDLGEWHASGPGAVDVSGGSLHLASGTSTEVTRVQYDAEEVPSDYALETRIGVDGYGSENGLAVYDGEYRLMLYFTDEGLTVPSVTGGFIHLTRWDEDVEMHDIRAEAVDGTGRVYVDGVDRGSFALQSSDGADKVEHWVKGDHVAELTVDRTTVSEFEPARGVTPIWDDAFADLDSWRVDGPGRVQLVESGAELTGEVSLSRSDAVPDRYRVSWRHTIARLGDAQTSPSGTESRSSTSRSRRMVPRSARRTEHGVRSTRGTQGRGHTSSP